MSRDDETDEWKAGIEKDHVYDLLDAVFPTEWVTEENAGFIGIYGTTPKCCLEATLLLSHRQSVVLGLHFRGSNPRKCSFETTLLLS